MTGRCISVCLFQSLWCYPVKNSLFAIISSNLWTQALAWTQAQRQSMKTFILWASAAKVSAPDLCRSSFLRDPGSSGGQTCAEAPFSEILVAQAGPVRMAATGFPRHFSRLPLPRGGGGCRPLGPRNVSPAGHQSQAFKGWALGGSHENWATKHVLLSRRRQKPRVRRTEWRQCHRPLASGGVC